MQNLSFEKFLWTDLIAFDNTRSDMGAQKYLQETGFIPDGISIFMWGSDFLHLHENLNQDEEFPPDIGSYMDMGYETKKQNGPPWFKFQLKQLIQELHKYHIKVVFSIFPISLADKFHKEFVSSHLELAIQAVKGFESYQPIINPLRRFNDGTFYEDFLIEKACKVIEDYGFDGWHLADGYNHPWYQLAHADIGDDMVEQFINYTKIELPEKFAVPCDSNNDLANDRMHYIWHNLRLEWINFHRWRNEVYLKKIIDAMHKIGKHISCNTCWTRDPVEAIYRYGIDYKKLFSLGMDHIVIETCSAGGEMMDKICRARFSEPFYQVLQSTVLLTRAYAGEGKILFNNCTQDITEGWSCIKYLPAFMEREIYGYSNTYYYNHNGELKKLFDGLQVCLGAGMERQDWNFLDEKWSLGFGTQATGLSGATVIWSDNIVNFELEYYLKTRNLLSANYLYHLLGHGLQCFAAANFSDIDKVKTPLIVFNPGLLPESEQQTLKNYKLQPLFLIGFCGAGFPQGNINISEGEFEFKAYNCAENYEEKLPALKSEIYSDLMDIPEPPSFFDEQFYRPLSDKCFQICADLINRNSHVLMDKLNDTHSDNMFFRFRGVKIDDNIWRYFIENDHYQYIWGDVFTSQPIESTTVLNNFRGRPIYWESCKKPDGFKTRLRIPPDGVGVIDLKLPKA